MASENNPWNVGSGGNRPPEDPPRGPRLVDGGPSWGGGGPGGGSGGPGGPGGPQPPNFDHLAGAFVLWLRHMMYGGGRVLALAGIALLGLWLYTSAYRVEPDELGLVLRFGAYNRSTPPGLNFHIPWPIETVLLLPVTRINRVEIGFRSEDSEYGAATTQDRDLREESLVLTGDENIVDINASVFWRISNAPDYAFNTRNPAETVKAVAESVLRQVLGHTKIQSALTEGRAAIEEGVTTGTQKILDGYGTGVEITQVQLQKVDPPAEVIESFRDVQRANTDADRVRNEAQSYANDIVPRARGDAATIVFAAQGDKQGAIAAANGQSQRFLSVYQAYAVAKDVTLKRLYIETMQDVLSHADTTVVDDKLRNMLPLLPLNGQRLDAVK
jgi:membrane protease subunit HflK